MEKISRKITRFTYVLLCLLAAGFLPACHHHHDDDAATTSSSWTYPASLSDNISPDGQDASDDAQVAMDDNGNAIIVWSQYNGTYDMIYKSEYRSGAWTNPTSLADCISPAGGDAIDPQVAMDNDGNAIITWRQNNGTYDMIYKSEYRGGAWTNPASLSDCISYTGGDTSAPQLAMDDNGNAIITWHQYTGTYRMIYKSEYRSGAWTNPTSLLDCISYTGGDAHEPQVAMDNNGNAIITWYQYNGTYNRIYKSEYRGGAWTNPASLSDSISYTGGYASAPQVAMDDNGNAIITWYQDTGTDWMIYKSEYRGGAWTNPASLSDCISYTGGSAYNTQVAMDNNGNAIITWEQYNGTNYMIFKSEYRDGAWTNPASLSDSINYANGDAGYPRVAMSDDGSAIITWHQESGSDVDMVYKSEYRGGAWTHPTAGTDNITPESMSYATPEVAMDADGNAIITWEQQDSGGILQIFLAEYR